MTDEQREKIKHYRILNEYAVPGQILFTGSSLMEQFPVNELSMSLGQNRIIYNRGVGGFTTGDMLECLEEMVFGPAPARIFINIGSNDLSLGEDILERLLENYREILKKIKKRLPMAEIFVMAYYPVNENAPEGLAALFVNRNNQTICRANKALKVMTEEEGCHFIEVNRGLVDEGGKLNM